MAIYITINFLQICHSVTITGVKIILSEFKQEQRKYVKSSQERRVELFLQSLELGLPYPFTRKRVNHLPPPPLGFQGKGHTRLREMRWVVPIRTGGQTLWYSRYTVYVHCGQE